MGFRNGCCCFLRNTATYSVEKGRRVEVVSMVLEDCLARARKSKTLFVGTLEPNTFCLVFGNYCIVHAGITGGKCTSDEFHHTPGPTREDPFGCCPQGGKGEPVPPMSFVTSRNHLKFSRRYAGANTKRARKVHTDAKTKIDTYN